MPRGHCSETPQTMDRADGEPTEHKTFPMRPSTTPAALAAVLALVCSKDNHSCMCNAFVISPKATVANRRGIPTDGRSRPTRARPHRRQNNKEDLVQLHASSSHGRYDHLHANARASANPNNRIYTQAQTETAQIVADQFIEAYLQSLPSLRRHSGDAVIQRSIEAVRRAIASYFMDAGNNNIGGNTGATNALPEGANAAALPFSSDADSSPAQQRLPSAAEATSNAQAAVHQAEAALTDYLDGLSSGQFVSTPSSAEAVGAIRSYLDSLAAVENEAASASSQSSNGSGVGKSFGQSSYLQYIDEVCDADADNMATGNAEECTRAIGSYLDALEAGTTGGSTPSSAAGTSRIMGYLDSIAAASSSSNEVAATPGSVTSPASGGGYLEALSIGDVPPSPSSWASADTSRGTSSSSFSPAGATPASCNEDETTINIASTTNIQNINALADISGGDGVIARSFHEEDGGDTITETTVTQEGDDTIVTIKSTTRLVLPKE